MCDSASFFYRYGYACSSSTAPNRRIRAPSLGVLDRMHGLRKIVQVCSESLSDARAAIETAQLHRLADVCRFNRIVTGDIGDGARQAEDAVIGARR